MATGRPRLASGVIVDQVTKELHAQPAYYDAGDGSAPRWISTFAASTLTAPIVTAAWAVGIAAAWCWVAGQRASWHPGADLCHAAWSNNLISRLGLDWHGHRSSPVGVPNPWAGGWTTRLGAGNVADLAVLAGGA